MKANVLLTISVLSASLTLAACGNSIAPAAGKSARATASLEVQAQTGAKPGSAASPTQAAAREVAPAAGGEATGGEAAGGEAALVTYANAQQGFSIDRPAPWTQDMSVIDGIKFAGGDGVMTLTFVKPNVNDVITYATNDAKAFAASLPSYKQVALAPSTEVPNAVLLGFETTGTSQVTGKAYAARGDRYYMPLKDGRIAVLTVISSVRSYDSQGVRDIALTLKVTK